MLLGLSIRNVVLIDQLDLDLSKGLCVLTGETGAGKSILLDSLGLALGYRSERSLLRAGAQQASVAAEFQVPQESPANRLLHDHGLEATDTLILRRILGDDGRSRAFINDQPVNVSLLKRVGNELVEIEGQFAEQGLLDPANHRAALDAFGGHLDQCRKVRITWREWRMALDALENARAGLTRAREEEEALKHALAELEALDPRAGEEEELANRRSLLMNSEKLIESVSAAARELGLADGAGDSVSDTLRTAGKHLEKAASLAPDKFASVSQALERAAIELTEAEAQLTALGNELEMDPQGLETVEERLFTLRDVARKHSVEVDDLPEIREKLAAQIDALSGGEKGLQRLTLAEEDARKAYCEATKDLSEKRRKAARALDAAVMEELPSLKLEKAVFRTRLDPLGEDEMGENGAEKVSFEISTNPGMAPGPLNRIASGGELARFMLALKVVVAATGNAASLIFDEVDSGVGGAVAAAVGERLSRLGKDRQVLVITHSPQVAAKGDAHWRVEKSEEAPGAPVTTRVRALNETERKEEIARMLAGAEITDEARAAAGRLLQTG